jgi:hypothetical protein
MSWVTGFAGMRNTLLIAAVVVGLLPACAPPRSEPPAIAGRRPADFAVTDYARAAADGRPVYQVDAASSLVVIDVRRAGPLARLGHDHVVAAYDLQGYVRPDAGRADLYVVLDRLVVDDPALRRQAGLDTEPSADAVAGTRTHMLDDTLDAKRFPFASIAVRGVAFGRENIETEMPADLTITVHGVTRALRVPIRITISASAIAARGRVTLAQTDFGMLPFSILGGAVQVQDEVGVRFDVRARRVAHSP